MSCCVMLRLSFPPPYLCTSMSTSARDKRKQKLPVHKTRCTRAAQARATGTQSTRVTSCFAKVVWSVELLRLEPSPLRLHSHNATNKQTDEKRSHDEGKPASRKLLFAPTEKISNNNIVTSRISYRGDRKSKIGGQHRKRRLA